MLRYLAYECNEAGALIHTFLLSSFTYKLVSNTTFTNTVSDDHRLHVGVFLSSLYGLNILSLYNKSATF